MQNKNTYIILGGIVILGTVFYFYNKNKNKKTDASTDSDSDKNKAVDKEVDKADGKTDVKADGKTDVKTDVKTDGKTDGKKEDKKYSFPFTTKEEGNKFREFVNAKYPDYAKKEAISKSGELNSYVEKAWVKYGKEYNTYKASPNKFEAQKKLIQKYATGIKSEATYLNQAPTTFVSNWSDAIKSKSKYFVYANQIYSSWTGVRFYDSNPINKKFYASKSGLIAKLNPSNSSSAFEVKKNTYLGKVKDIRKVGSDVWFYLPEESLVYKWYKSNYVSPQKSSIENKKSTNKLGEVQNAKITQIITSSTFDGSITDEIEFSGFDNNFDLDF